MEILDCSQLADKLEEKAKNAITSRKLEPCLAILLVGDNFASKKYVQMKIEFANKTGIKTTLVHLKENATESEILSFIDDWNCDDEISGILVQLPLPKHINQFKILDSIWFKKDVDGLTSVSLGRLVHKEKGFVSCTSYGIIEILRHHNLKIKGKTFAIINSSILIGKPLALLLLNECATPIICHEFTNNIREITKSSDYIITAIGKRPNVVIDNSFCHDKSIIFDVGVSKIDGKTVGDVNLDSLKDTNVKVTKAIGGVGAITIRQLALNTIVVCQNGL